MAFIGSRAIFTSAAIRAVRRTANNPRRIYHKGHLENGPKNRSRRQTDASLCERASGVNVLLMTAART